MEYSTSDLEDEVYDFMMTSENPSAFPTKDELVAAGRGDLALAIAERGGWLALGWDLDDDDDNNDDDADGSRVFSSSDASSSGREQVNWEDKEVEDGIQGILSRLDKERNFSYSLKGGEEMAFRGGFSDNIWNLRTSVMPDEDPAKDAVVATEVPAKDAVVATEVPAKAMLIWYEGCQISTTEVMIINNQMKDSSPSCLILVIKVLNGMGQANTKCFERKKPGIHTTGS